MYTPTHIQVTGKPPDQIKNLGQKVKLQKSHFHYWVLLITLIYVLF